MNDNYDWQQAAVDAIILQTSNAALRERALQENVTYDQLLKMGIVKEQSAKGAAFLEQASGQQSVKVKMEEEVRRLQSENKQLKSKMSQRQCYRCGREKCPQGSKCPANGQKCSKCKKMNHFAKVCRSSSEGEKKSSFGQLSSADESDSEESSGSIVVGNLDSQTIGAKITVQGPLNTHHAVSLMLATDTGISKTLLNSSDWSKVKGDCKFVKTLKHFRPYGTKYQLPIKGKARVTLTAERGAKIDTWVYVVNDKREQSLLGESDAVRLGIVKLDLKGSTEEVIRRVSYIPKPDPPSIGIVSGNETQEEINKRMKAMISQFPSVFTDVTGKFQGEPIKIQLKLDTSPVIQPPCRVPMHYWERLRQELEKMKEEDIIEGPITIEEPGTFLSNLVITDKKGTDRIHVTLDCQAVNKAIYATHEPVPTPDELRHYLGGSDRFSTLDMTNCYYQFEIEPSARKLYAFRSPWGIYQYKHMVMGTSPVSSEIQKRIREAIKGCKNTIHIKDDILVFGAGQEHDRYLEDVLRTLQENSITLRPEKCRLGQPEVKWFGNIYSKHGVSPYPEKGAVIRT